MRNGVRLHPAIGAIVAMLALALASTLATAAGSSLRFFGTVYGDVDRVKIRIDDPSNSLPGPAADVGATDFTFELWIKASAANDAPAVACGASRAWRAGNVVVDRDRRSADRGYGIAIAGGRIAFGGAVRAPAITRCAVRRR